MRAAIRITKAHRKLILIKLPFLMDGTKLFINLYLIIVALLQTSSKSMNTFLIPLSCFLPIRDRATRAYLQHHHATIYSSYYFIVTNGFT